VTHYLTEVTTLNQPSSPPGKPQWFYLNFSTVKH